MSRTGVVAALAAEGRTLGPIKTRQHQISRLADGTLLAVSGIGGVAAGHAARALVAAGATALASWGVAGGLDPTLTPGTLVLPGAVVTTDGRRYSTTGAWRNRVQAGIGRRAAVAGGVLLTSSSAVDTVAAKSAAFRTTGALSVDMESVAIAEIAAANELPFLVVRAIVDTATDVLPRSVIAASRSGRLQLWRLLRGLAADPRELAALLRLARRYRAARRSLVAAAQSGALLGPS